MISVGLLFSPVGLIVCLVIATAGLALWRFKLHQYFLTDLELSNTVKILFVVASIMLLIGINNSISLPEAQFIYGRF